MICASQKKLTPALCLSPTWLAVAVQMLVPAPPMMGNKPVKSERTRHGVRKNMSNAPAWDESSSLQALKASKIHLLPQAKHGC